MGFRWPVEAGHICARSHLGAKRREDHRRRHRGRGGTGRRAALKMPFPKGVSVRLRPPAPRVRPRLTKVGIRIPLAAPINSGIYAVIMSLGSRRGTAKRHPPKLTAPWPEIAQSVGGCEDHVRVQLHQFGREPSAGPHICQRQFGTQ